METMMHTSSKAVRLLVGALVATVAALGVAACGGDDNGGTTSAGSASTSSASAGGSTAGGGTKLTTDATEKGGLSFSKKTLEAKAGSVTLSMPNPSGNSLPHGIAIEGGGVEKSGSIVQPGGDSTLTVTLKPGTYTFYCPVGSHRQQGMEGKLTVK
jgi:uncharacterized cupredoxin-like copper-binding protein